MKIIIYVALLLGGVSLYAQGPVGSDAVVFQSGFEEGNKDIWDDYDGNPDTQNQLIADPGPYGTAGNTVMRLVAPSGQRGGADLVKVLPSQYDSLYVRWFIKYEKGFNFNAKNHGGGLHAGSRDLMGMSGQRPDGTNRAAIGLEYDPTLHTPQIYTYYRGMYQDCANPNGSCWGDVFPCTSDDGKTYCEVPEHRDPPLPPTLEDDRWYCMEMKFKLGTPSPDGSIRDGEIALWVDGVNYGKWDDLWMRTTDQLKITTLWLSLFHHDGAHSDAGVLYDDVVVSTQPIGTRKVSSGYSETQHRELVEGEIPVSEPGHYGTPGATYVLVNDIVSPRSAIFLGNNVTLDLNGYEIVYADAGYEHLPNYDFEEGLVGWDFSKAPTAKIEGKKVQVFVGDNVLRLKAGEEITSAYIDLPEDDRSYFAICGVAKNTMRVSVYIEDENGDVVYCTNEYGSGQRQGSPVENKGTQLGGGFVFAHMKGKPAGKYRVRVKANTDAIVDHIDLRPALDVGVGIVERTYTNTHTDQLYDGWYDPAFYDYTKVSSTGEPLDGIPVVERSATGTITIKNGVIRSGATGVLSWGIQSTAVKVDLFLDNVKVITQGINTNAVEVRQANITNCYFDVNTPFIINRHNSGNYGVDILGTQASEVSYSEFYGGQGCLSIAGIGSKIHHNYFENRQTVTNHYALAPANYAEVYDNVFKAETGSGIGMGGLYAKVYNNEIHIESAPPTCEYGHEDYSVNGVRMADYNAALGDLKGCFGNEIFNNKFFITGKDYPEYVDYIPVATAIFYSASAGDNFVYDNEIVVNALDPDSKAITNAFYVGGGTVGGVFENNTVTTNVPAFWLASPYGRATKTKVLRNTIIRAPNAKDDYVPVRLGYGGYLATDIDFVSNKIVGGNGKLEFGGTQREHTFAVKWALVVNVVDDNGNGVGGTEVRILDKSGTEVLKETTSDEGRISTVLTEYRYVNRLEQSANPYRIIVGEKEVTLSIDEDTEITVSKDNITGIGMSPETEFKLYPNPMADKLMLRFHDSAERRIVISDINQRIQSDTVSRNPDIEIDLTRFSAGIYFLRVSERAKTVTTKFIKY